MQILKYGNIKNIYIIKYSSRYKASFFYSKDPDIANHIFIILL